MGKEGRGSFYRDQTVPSTDTEPLHTPFFLSLLTQLLSLVMIKKNNNSKSMHKNKEAFME